MRGNNGKASEKSSKYYGSENGDINKNNIKNDINYYLNYLSPTSKKAAITLNTKNVSSYDYSYTKSEQKGNKSQNNQNQGNLFSFLSSKQQDKNVNDINDLEEFTKEFKMSNVKQNNSLFQQKLTNAQIKFSGEKSYLK